MQNNIVALIYKLSTMKTVNIETELIWWAIFYWIIQMEYCAS